MVRTRGFRGLWGVLVGGLALLAAAGLGWPGPAVAAGPLVVGVSWGSLESSERWRQDEAALREALAAAGAVYLSADARGTVEKQVADLDRLVAGGAQVLVVVALDSGAVQPPLARARQKSIPVIAYDRLVEAPDIFHVGFDNREVGRIGAREVLRRRPRGNVLLLLGAPADVNVSILLDGMLDVLRPAVTKGNVGLLGRLYAEGWRQEEAERLVAEFLNANPDKGLDAVLAGNDRLAAGALAALQGRGRDTVVITGQDAEKKALNRIARGTQAATVFKDVRQLARTAAQVALALGSGTPATTIPHAVRWQRAAEAPRINAVLLAPVAVTRDTLRQVLEAEWATRDDICADIPSAQAPSLCW